VVAAVEALDPRAVGDELTRALEPYALSFANDILEVETWIEGLVDVLEDARARVDDVSPADRLEPLVERWTAARDRVAALVDSAGSGLDAVTGTYSRLSGLVAQATVEVDAQLAVVVKAGATQIATATAA